MAAPKRSRTRPCARKRSPCWPNTRSRWPRRSTAGTRSGYSVLYAEDEDLRAFRVLVVDAFLRQMQVLTDLLGIPVPERM